MANASIFLSDLKTGRCSSTVQVRLLRFWEAMNVRRGGDLIFIRTSARNMEDLDSTPRLKARFNL